MSELVPEGWKDSTIGDIASVKRGASPRPIQDPKWWGGNVGWVRISDVTRSSKYLFKTTDYLSDEGVAKSVKIKQGEVILSICATIGKPIIVKTDACIHDGFVWFDKLPKSIDREFFYYTLKEKEEFLASQRQSGTQGNLNTSIVSSLRVYLPPLPEQQKIATILTSVDNVIEKTEAQINKLQDLKKGMMQELLTKGIGRGGIPHTEFKDSPVGRIPKSWKVVSLGDITEESAFGPRFSSDFYSENGNIGCIRTTDMDKNWDIDYSTVPLANLRFDEFKSHILRDGDLLVTRSGTCGVVDVFKEQSVPMVAAAFLIRFRLSEAVNPWFIRIALMSSSIQENIQMLASGGVQKNLSGTNLKTLLLPLPSREEQDLIVSIVNSGNSKIAVTNKKLRGLQSLKKALMQDLLTGKVRVKINESAKEVVVD